MKAGRILASRERKASAAIRKFTADSADADIANKVLKKMGRKMIQGPDSGEVDAAKAALQGARNRYALFHAKGKMRHDLRNRSRRTLSVRQMQAANAPKG